MMTDLLERGEQTYAGGFEQVPVQMTLGEVSMDYDLAIVGMKVGSLALSEDRPKLADMPPVSIRMPKKRYLEPKVHKPDELLRSTFTVVYPEGENPLIIESGVVINPRLLT